MLGSDAELNSLSNDGIFKGGHQAKKGKGEDVRISSVRLHPHPHPRIRCLLSLRQKVTFFGAISQNTEHEGEKLLLPKMINSTSSIYGNIFRLLSF
jgi:hypothetical protein